MKTFVYFLGGTLHRERREVTFLGRWINTPEGECYEPKMEGKDDQGNRVLTYCVVTSEG